MMKKEKSLAAQLMAKARWAKTSKKQRSDHAKAMVQARERKKAKALTDDCDQAVTDGIDSEIGSK